MPFADQVKILMAQATKEGIYRLGSHGSLLPSTAYSGRVGPGTYVARAREVTMVSEPADLLEKLYATADIDVRRYLAPTLLQLLNSQNARVVARTLVVTDQLKALHQLVRRDTAAEELWRGVVHALRFESPLFSEDDLETVSAAAKSLRDAERASEVAQVKKANRNAGSVRVRARAVRDQSGGIVVFRTPLSQLADEMDSVVSRIRYLRLAKVIREHENPVVDADRQILLSRLQGMGFSVKLTSASDEIEQRAIVATTDTDVKVVMDLLRTFYEEFIEEACRKSEPKVGKPVPRGPQVAHFQPYKQYLENAGLIGPEESELLQKLYNFLSNQGAHKLGSAPEQLKVARTTVIEWCMLIAGRISILLG